MFLNFMHIGVAIHIENQNIIDFFEDRYVNQVAVHKFEPYIEIVELRDSNLYSKALSSLDNANSVSFMRTDIAYNDNRIIFFSNDTSINTIQQVSLFLCFIMQTVLSNYNVYILHGACIVENNQGIVIIGKSGAGKSSIVLKEITQHNKKLITDDILILTKIDGQITAIKNIHSIGISKKDLNCHYPYLKPYLDISQKNTYQIKPRINYDKYDMAVYVDQIKIKKIIFLCEKQITASIKKIEAGQAFKYLLNSHKFYFNGVIDFLDIFSDMVNICNCYQLNICNNVEETIKVLNDVIDNE